MEIVLAVILGDWGWVGGGARGRGRGEGLWVGRQGGWGWRVGWGCGMRMGRCGMGRVDKDRGRWWARGGAGHPTQRRAIHAAEKA